MTLTYRDILCPKTQKFPIGTRVRITGLPASMSHFPTKVGTEWLIEGSYAQVCAAHHNPDNPECERHYHQYSVIDPETGHSCAWVKEDMMEVVPSPMETWWQTQVAHVDSDIHE